MNCSRPTSGIGILSIPVPQTLQNILIITLDLNQDTFLSHVNIVCTVIESLFFRFLVCLVHGLGGHCARFDELALYLNTLGAFVFAHDHGMIFQ